MMLKQTFLYVFALGMVLTTPQASAEILSAGSGYEAYMQSLRTVPAGMSQRQLKVYLLDSYFEVYAFYSELPAEKQARVFDFYSEQESADISELDAKIRELL